MIYLTIKTNTQETLYFSISNFLTLNNKDKIFLILKAKLEVLDILTSIGFNNPEIIQTIYSTIKPCIKQAEYTIKLEL